MVCQKRLYVDQCHMTVAGPSVPLIAVTCFFFFKLSADYLLVLIDRGLRSKITYCQRNRLVSWPFALRRRLGGFLWQSAIGVKLSHSKARVRQKLYLFPSPTVHLLKAEVVVQWTSEKKPGLQAYCENDFERFPTDRFLLLNYYGQENRISNLAVLWSDSVKFIFFVFSTVLFFVK